MAKLIAIHALHLAGATAGTVDVINPGEGFDAREDELYLADPGVGAARKATADDKNAVFVGRSGAAGSGLAAASEDISKLKKADLIALAAAEEIQIDESATNAVIVKAIEDARAAKQDDLV